MTLVVGAVIELLADEICVVAAVTTGESVGDGDGDAAWRMKE